MKEIKNVQVWLPRTQKWLYSLTPAVETLSFVLMLIHGKISNLVGFLHTVVNRT